MENTQILFELEKSFAHKMNKTVITFYFAFFFI